LAKLPKNCTINLNRIRQGERPPPEVQNAQFWLSGKFAFFFCALLKFSGAVFTLKGAEIRGVRGYQNEALIFLFQTAPSSMRSGPRGRTFPHCKSLWAKKQFFAQRSGLGLPLRLKLKSESYIWPLKIAYKNEAVLYNFLHFDDSQLL
jgi:hypothetical protein